jgi:transmembrane sensor
VALADGTRLSINTASLVDVRFTADQRLIRLHRGEILVDTGNDPGHATRRPFRVATEQGMLEALGTRFTVKTLEKDGPTHLAVFDGAVTITPAASGETLLLQAGQQVRFSRSDIAPATALGDAEPPWSRGLLIADDMRFGDFIDELSRYRSGILRCDPRAAELRINGAFRLDNTDAIIRALPATLPVDVSYLTRYWVSIAYRES